MKRSPQKTKSIGDPCCSSTGKVHQIQLQVICSVLVSIFASISMRVILIWNCSKMLHDGHIWGVPSAHQQEKCMKANEKRHTYQNRWKSCSPLGICGEKFWKHLKNTQKTPSLTNRCSYTNWNWNHCLWLHLNSPVDMQVEHTQYWFLHEHIILRLHFVMDNNHIKIDANDHDENG